MDAHQPEPTAAAVCEGEGNRGLPDMPDDILDHICSFFGGTSDYV